MSATFTIVSTAAPLVEVSGSGPYVDLAGGLAVPAGVPTIGPVDLLDGFIRFWRVDAPTGTQAKVIVSDSPFGALLGVRRCAEAAKSSNGVVRAKAVEPIDVMASMHNLGEHLWNAPVRDAVHTLFQLTPLFLAALLADLVDGDSAPAACAWQDVTEKATGPVTAQGGDIVVVSFVVP